MPRVHIYRFPSFVDGGGRLFRFTLTINAALFPISSMHFARNLLQASYEKCVNNCDGFSSWFMRLDNIHWICYLNHLIFDIYLHGSYWCDLSFDFYLPEVRHAYQCQIHDINSVHAMTIQMKKQRGKEMKNERNMKWVIHKQKGRGFGVTPSSSAFCLCGVSVHIRQVTLSSKYLII